MGGTPANPGKTQKRGRAALTRIERRVLRELLGGTADKEVALKLGLEEGAVRTHIRRILKKLDVQSIREVITSFLKEPPDR